jgi:VWFA-related protein
MSFTRFAAASLTALFVLPLAAFAQLPQPSLQLPSSTPPSKSIKLDVVVYTKSGLPVTTLHQQDFTVLDNKSPRPITSFAVLTSADEPVEVILYLDAVNTPYELLAEIRVGTDKFLREKEGVLAHPTTVAVLTDDGLQIANRFSTNGMALSDDLKHRQIGLRKIGRGAQWSSIDLFEIGIKAIHQLVAFASKLPGRKIVLFISPGFPLLSGPNAQMTAKQQQEIFGDAVYLSTQLRQNNIAFYNIDPVGVSQSMYSANYYQTFLKGVTNPGNAQFASLSPQVLSVQSGGLTLISSNDLPGMIQRCVLDADSWYQISFDPLPSEKPNEYHHVEIRVDRPGVVVRTRDGYYANPTPVIIH